MLTAEQFKQANLMIETLKAARRERASIAYERFGHGFKAEKEREVWLAEDSINAFATAEQKRLENDPAYMERFRFEYTKSQTEALKDPAYRAERAYELRAAFGPDADSVIDVFSGLPIGKLVNE